MTDSTTSSPIETGAPPDSVTLGRIAQALRDEGYYDLGPVLGEDEVAALREAMERKWSDPAMREDEAGDHIRGISLMRMFEYDVAFRDLIAREPFPTIAESVLGDDCHLMSQNALYSDPRVGGGWHLDDLCQHPLPDGCEGHLPDVPPPCNVLQIFIAVMDMDTPERAPTQVVPGSHYAGRRPDKGIEEPTFRGRGPVSIFAKAGDAYMFDNQIWHRGSVNTMDRPRLLAGVTYSRRHIAQRFYPFIDYVMPAHVWEGADERLQRLLGRHEKGAYG
jgi:hypothetical protein